MGAEVDRQSDGEAQSGLRGQCVPVVQHVPGYIVRRSVKRGLIGRWFFGEIEYDVYRNGRCVTTTTNSFGAALAALT